MTLKAVLEYEKEVFNRNITQGDVLCSLSEEESDGYSEKDEYVPIVVLTIIKRRSENSDSVG